MTARPLRSSKSYAQARSPAETFAPQDAYRNRVKIRCPYELAARRRERRAALRDEGAADSWSGRRRRTVAGAVVCERQRRLRARHYASEVSSSLFLVCQQGRYPNPVEPDALDEPADVLLRSVARSLASLPKHVAEQAPSA